MANKTNLSSWGNLRNYLATNVDPDKDWDNEDIKDYSALLDAQAAGKVTGDKFTEGRNLFQHYLADAQATDTYQKAQAQAANEARRETAYGNYLSTRLGSYLREIQGNAGIAGYAGLTQGQAIAVKNDQENAFRAIQDNKRTALQGALDTYQGALASHSQTAIDQATAIDAAREAKNEDKKLAVQEYVKQYLDNTDTDSNGMYSEATVNKVNEYIESSGLSEEDQAEVMKNVDLVSGDALPRQGVDDSGNKTQVQTETQKANREKAQKDRVYTIEHLTDKGTIKSSKEEDEKAYTVGDITEAEWNERKAAYDKAELKAYKSYLQSSFLGLGVCKGNTGTIKFENGSNDLLVNDNTTVTWTYDKIALPDAAKGFGNGQAFLYSDPGTNDGRVEVWVSDGKSEAHKVADHAGDGPWEDLKRLLTGTVYDLTK